MKIEQRAPSLAAAGKCAYELPTLRRLGRLSDLTASGSQLGFENTNGGPTGGTCGAGGNANASKRVCG